MKTFFFLWNLVFALTYVSGSGSGSVEVGVDYLYGNNHYPVKEYTGGNAFENPNPKPRIVEFYSPHCPACVAFQPEYVNLAQKTKAQHKEVAFFAVSCDHHEDVCKKFGIGSYPTLIAFPAGEQNGLPVPHGHYTPGILARKLQLDGSVEMLRRRRMDERNGDDDDDNVGSNNNNNNNNNSGGGGDDDDTNNNNNGDDDANNNNGGNGDDDANSNVARNGDDDASSNGGNGDDDANNNVAGNGDDDEVNNNASGNGDDDDANNNAAGNGDDDANNNAAGNGDDDEANNSATGNGDDDANNNGRNGDDDADNNGRHGDDDANNNGDDDAANNGNGDDDSQGSNQGDDRFRGQFRNQDQYRPPLPQVPQVIHTGRERRPGAGAIRARGVYKDMDRFQEEMQGHRMEYDKKRRGVGRFIRKDERKDKRGKPMGRSHADSMTKTMRVHTPGTAEYNERREKVMKRVKKVKKDVSTHFTKEQLPYKKDVRKETFMRKQASRLPVVKRLIKMTPEEELILDVSVSLVGILRTGVFTGINEGELSREKKNALKDFLDLLNVSLPPEWGIHKLIDDLRRRIAFIAQNERNLRYVIDQHPLSRTGWSNSCTRGRNRASGMYCGFWKTLHVASVGVAEHRGGLNLIDSGMVSESTKVFSPIEAADAMKNFIEYFFTCQSCREHFVAHYENCDNNRRCDRLTEELEDASTADWKELAVWLWEVHNEVSIHVVHQRVERDNTLSLGGNVKVKRRATVKDEVQVLWPNVEICVMCFNEDGTWDEPEVFKFLERKYWPDSELDPKLDKLMMFEGESGFMSGLFLWILVLGVVYFIYTLVMKNSAAINRSVLMSRQLVLAKTAAVASKKKERTN